MNCTNCKNPVDENTTECEWCNFVLNNRLIKSNDSNFQPINKGECLFFSKHIKKTACFYEIYKDGIKIFDREEKINIFIKREVIYNVENFKRLLWMHFIPIIGSIIRLVIIGLSKYRRGFSIITSKSGKNFIVVKNINYQTFNSTISSFIQNQI